MGTPEPAGAGLTDPVALTAALVRCASVTPDDAGSLDLLEGWLTGLGFQCRRHAFAAPGTRRVDNLYARWGRAAPNLCFAGHVDVVPVGDHAAWTADAFAATIRDGVMIGRGASDMKGGIACWVAAVARLLAGEPPPGSLSLLITADEEGPAVNGTEPLIAAVTAAGETIDHCLVGEPTNPDRLGQEVKIGRRGSLTGSLRVEGVQGHSAYPHLADNPVNRLVRMLNGLLQAPLDAGTEHFVASNLEVTSIDVGNPACNVIPAAAEASFNIRFNSLHDAAGLEEWLRATFDAVGGRYTLQIACNAHAFMTEPGPFVDIVVDAVAAHCDGRPQLTTTGGTSDARFIKNYCPVVEFGLTYRTIHKVDEQVRLDDLRQLTDIYGTLMTAYFDGIGRRRSQ